jgi:hypothetical protein
VEGRVVSRVYTEERVHVKIPAPTLVGVQLFGLLFPFTTDPALGDHAAVGRTKVDAIESGG